MTPESETVTPRESVSACQEPQAERRESGPLSAIGSEIIGEAFNAGFNAALKIRMRCDAREVLTVKVDAWLGFVKSQSQNEKLAERETATCKKETQ